MRRILQRLTIKSNWVIYTSVDLARALRLIYQLYIYNTTQKYIVNSQIAIIQYIKPKMNIRICAKLYSLKHIKSCIYLYGFKKLSYFIN